MTCEKDQYDEVGFTLLELLVSLALLSLIAGGLVMSLGTASNVWQSSQRIEANVEPLKLRSDLRRWVEAAAPKVRNYPYATDVSGTDKYFTFVSKEMVPNPHRAFAMRVELFTKSNELSARLSFRDEKDIEVGFRELLIATQREGFIFEYYRGVNGQGDWDESWSNEDQLPDLIRIRSLSPSASWPEFVVAPLLK